jgi:SP family sugar:H+ symporter-like MFS transporter
VVVTVVAILLVDGIGRRKLLLIGSIGVFVSLAVMSTDFPQPPGRGFQRCAVASTLRSLGSRHTDLREPVRGVLRRVVGSGDVGPARRDVPQSHPRHGDGPRDRCELDLQLHHHGDVPTAAGFLAGFTYGLYALFALLSFFLVLAKIPETKGMELEDISMNTMSHKRPRVS